MGDSDVIMKPDASQNMGGFTGDDTKYIVRSLSARNGHESTTGRK